jgi:hypothetical protein
MVAAKLANMQQGARTDIKPSANFPKVVAISQPSAASMLNVSDRSVRDAKTVLEKGIPELAARVEAGEIAVSLAAKIATMPDESVSVGERRLRDAGPAG